MQTIELALLAIGSESSFPGGVFPADPPLLASLGPWLLSQEGSMCVSISKNDIARIVSFPWGIPSDPSCLAALGTSYASMCLLPSYGLTFQGRRRHCDSNGGLRLSERCEPRKVWNARFLLPRSSLCDHQFI
jgi:hypothetical protein